METRRTGCVEPVASAFPGTQVESAMNAREAADVVVLLNRIDELLREFMRTESEERQAAIKAELEEATDRLQRIALSFQN